MLGGVQFGGLVQVVFLDTVWGAARGASRAGAFLRD